jgi:hypothetical protein
MKSIISIAISFNLLLAGALKASPQAKPSTVVDLKAALGPDLKMRQPEKALNWKPTGSNEISPRFSEQLRRSKTYMIETKSMSGGVDLGGGVVVEINKRAALRDLVDNTTCDWISGLEFQNRFVPQAQKIIEKIKTHHWYLGHAYSHEAADALVCLTSGPLKKIPDQDLDAVTVFPFETKQVAVRAGRMIFVDMTIFANMINQTHRDFLWIHELTHSFIPFEREGDQRVQRRYESLRSFVRALSKDFDGERLAINIEANQLNMPPTTLEIDYYKKEILAVFDPQISIATRAQIATTLGRAISPQLWITDRRRLIETVNQYSDISDQIWLAIAQEDLQRLQHLYKLHNISTSEKLFIAHQDGCYYYPTGLQVALFKCSSQAPQIRFQPKVATHFLKALNHIPNLEELRFFITRTLRQTPQYNVWVVLWEKNPNYPFALTLVDQLVSQIPYEKINSYLADEVVQSSDLMRTSLLKRQGKSQ